MALTLTSLSTTSTADDSSQQTHTSSSFTPTAGAKLYAAAISQNDGNATAQVWSCSGGGLTWTQVAITGQAGFSTYATHTVLYEATVGGSPSSMTVTVDPHSGTVATYMSLRVFEITPGSAVSYAQAAVVSDTGSSGPASFASGTLAGSATSGNLSVAILGRSAGTGAPGTPSGWTAFTLQTAQWTNVNVYHRTDFTGTSVTWTDTGPSFSWGTSILVEFEEIPTGTASPAVIARAAAVPAATATSTGNTAPFYVQGKAAAYSSSTSPSVTFDAGVQTGDVVYFYCTHGTASMALNSSTPPPGWVNVLGGTTVVAAGAANSACAVYRIIASGENGQTTFTATALFSGALTGNVLAAVIRNVDLTTPIDNFGTTSSGSVVTPHVLAAITGTGSALDANSLVVSAVSKDGTGSHTTPGTHTMRHTSNSTCATWLGTHNTLTTANTNVTAVNITPSASDEYSSISVAFKVASVGGATATPAVTARLVTLPAATPQAGTTTSPALVARVVVVPQATATASVNGTATPAVIARSVALPAPTPQAGSTTAPTVIASSVTLPAPTSQAGSTTAPTVIARVVAVPTVSASGASTGTAVPAVITTTTTMAATTVSGAGNTSPAVIARAVTVPAATASGASPGTTAPTVIARVVALPAATTQAGSSKSPTVIARSVALPAAIGQASKTITAPLIARSVVISAVTTSSGTGGVAAPAVIARVTVIPAPTPLAGSKALPSVIALSVTLPAPSAGLIASGDATPATITLTLVMSEPRATGAYALYVGTAPVTAAYLGTTLITGNSIHLGDAVGLFAAATFAPQIAALLVAADNLYYGADPVEAIYLGDTLITDVHVGAS